jgi:hypothetical protein
MWGHTKKQCTTALVGVKSLLKRIVFMQDDAVRKHTSESAIEIIDNLLRENKGKKDE